MTASQCCPLDLLSISEYKREMMFQMYIAVRSHPFSVFAEI